MAKIKKRTNNGITLIKKANNLIESRYKFDQWETRMFLAVIKQIRKEDTEFKTYRIWFKDVIKMFCLKSGDSYELLRKGAKSLMGKSFFIAYETPEGISRETQYHILRKIDYMQEGNTGEKVENNEYIDVEVEQDMKPLLLQLQKNFTTYDIQNVVKLAVYPIRVYELLKQYQSIGRRKLGVEEIKTMFEVTERYKLFGDFFRWVIKPSIRDINKYTDLMVTEVNKIKTGRKVTALEFIFHGKSQEAINKIRGITSKSQMTINLGRQVRELDSPALAAVERLKENEKDKMFKLFQGDIVQRFGVTPTVFIKLLDEYTKEQVEQAIEVTNRAKFNQQIKSTLAGFFIYALKNGYTDEKIEAKKKKQKDNLQKLYKEELTTLEQQRAKNITEKIKEITAVKSEVTTKAIFLLNQHLDLKEKITIKEKELNRALVVEDYRKDPALREAVVNKIIVIEEKAFAPIFADFERQRELLKAKYKK